MYHICPAQCQIQFGRGEHIDGLTTGRDLERSLRRPSWPHQLPQRGCARPAPPAPPPFARSRSPSGRLCWQAIAAGWLPAAAGRPFAPQICIDTARPFEGPDKALLLHCRGERLRFRSHPDTTPRQPATQIRHDLIVRTENKPDQGARAKALAGHNAHAVGTRFVCTHRFGVRAAARPAAPRRPGQVRRLEVRSSRPLSEPP